MTGKKPKSTALQIIIIHLEQTDHAVRHPVILVIQQNNWHSWLPAFGGLSLVLQASRAALDHLVPLDLLEKMASPGSLDHGGCLA